MRTTDWMSSRQVASVTIPSNWYLPLAVQGSHVFHSNERPHFIKRNIDLAHRWKGPSTGLDGPWVWPLVVMEGLYSEQRSRQGGWSNSGF